MERKLKRIDVSGVPELLTIAEEVRNTRDPRLLRRDNEDLAIVMPVKPASKPRTRRVKTKADYESFRSAAGGWKDVDTDRLVADIYADRRISNRPAIEL
ncbi:MAG: hypothetical protein Q7R39_15800 [Dehalococcoidia bacterium]|nr:hypothetical protein [Dehalococcoidia bacterium]